MKKYKVGIVVGRFQTLHTGHLHIIDELIERCDIPVVVIGSSNKFRTPDNPFTIEERTSFLRTVYGTDITIFAVPDRKTVVNDNSWGEYLIEELGFKPDVIISGDEPIRNSWFEKLNIKEEFIPKSDCGNISATKLRELMLAGNYDEWKEYIHPKLRSQFETMKKILEDIQKGNKDE